MGECCADGPYLRTVAVNHRRVPSAGVVPARQVSGAELVSAEPVYVLVAEQGEPFDVVVSDLETGTSQMVEGGGW